ncbi:MAG: TolC family protein [Pseudomonadota bacterium]
MMRTRPLPALLFLGTALSACVSYRPQPLDPARSATALDARQAALPVGRPATEADLIALGAANAPALRNAAAALRTAMAAARTARVRSLGTLTLTTEYSHQDNPQRPWLVGATGDVPLDLGARRSGRIDTADLAVIQACYDYAEALWTLRSAIRRAAIDLRAADAETVLAEQALALRRERLDRFERRVRAGEDSRPVALAARTELLAAERRRAEAVARGAQARAALAAALGLPVSALAGLALATDVAAVPAAADPRLDAWRRDALLTRSDVLRAVADYDQSEDALRIEVARQYPEIHLGPGYIFERGITKLPFSLPLVLPPADLNRAAIREAEMRRAAAGTRLEGVQAAILSAVDTARASLAAAAIAAARARGPDLAVVARIQAGTDSALKLGAADRTDALAAAAVVVEARLAAAEADRLERQAAVDAEDAVRHPFDDREAAALAAAMTHLETITP